MNDRLAEERGQDSESLSALQAEVDDLQRQLNAAKRKTATSNSVLPQTPTIATIFLPAVRGIGDVRNVEVARAAKVVNIKIPVSADDGQVFSISVLRDNNAVLKTNGVKPVINGQERTLTFALPSNLLSDGRYDVVLKSDTQTERTRSFAVRFR